MGMRYWIGCATIGVALSAGAWAFAQGPFGPGPAPPSKKAPRGGPRAELSPTELNFGEVWQGTPAKGEFTLQNVGTAPLKVRVKSTCGCTPVTKPKSPLAPGESTTFTISYDTLKRKGRANQRITLTTNDPVHGKFEIKVTGNVKPLYKATPRDGVFFHKLHADSRLTQTVTFTNEYESPLHLKLKEGQDFGPFEVMLQEIRPGAEYVLTTTTRPPLPPKMARLGVVLETGLEQPPELNIPVVAYVQPDVLCRPSELRVARQLTVATTQHLQVSHRADKPIQITAVRPSHQAVTYELRKPSPPRAGWVIQAINVTFPPGSELPQSDAWIDIITDSSDERFQTLRVKIQVVDATKRKGSGARPGPRISPGQDATKPPQAPAPVKITPQRPSDAGSSKNKPEAPQK